MTDSEKKEWDLKLRKMDEEITNLRASTNSMIAQTTKINTENRWYVWVVASGFTLALVAVVKLFI